MITPLSRVAGTPRAVHGGPQKSGAALEGPVRIDFSSNVNAWGAAPETLQAAARADVEEYPDPEARAPRRTLARVWGEATDRIRFVPGASEAIHRVCRVFLRPGERVVLPEPTFGEYARAVFLAGGKVEGIPCISPGLNLPVPELVRACRKVAPRLVFLCLPNNPTGETVPTDALREIAQALPADSLLVLDTSFGSFSAGTFAPLPLREERERGRALVIHSLTKDLALAGARAGAVAGHPILLEALDAAAVPWDGSAPAQAAVTAALSPEGLAHLEDTLTRCRNERKRFAAELREKGWAPLPSSTNFILSHVGPAGAEVGVRLAERGIRVRDCTSFGLPEHLRVAVRRPEENDELLAALTPAR